MASIFTYDPDPPRVASPWHVSPSSTPGVISPARRHALAGGEVAPAAMLNDCGITKLEAEPQEGPTEYKLHLLLRPRRSFSASSTVYRVSGSYQSKLRAPRPESGSEPKAVRSSPLPTPTSQVRQNRLQHLTTQLLWRLQQSSPYHSSSTADLIQPVLPDMPVEFTALSRPGKPLPGIEDSRGALYEIGVSDDGTLVGLIKDELEESLANLRVMAASLGCKVEVHRMVVVGDCKWIEDSQPKDKVAPKIHAENLWVAEAFVVPDLEYHNSTSKASSRNNNTAPPSVAQPHRCDEHIEEEGSRTKQLRVTVTGSTTSGKSSLLGTLSTSTLDNGRGKSRLSLLKHRHEIATGVTSSVAPALIGYRDPPVDSERGISSTDVINYASGNVSTWNDIHSTAEAGRLVFLIDSAGHPRYRRTAVRGLVSWAPHWTLCCVAADDADAIGKIGATASAQEVLGSAGAGMDLSTAHLRLCLKLGLSLVVVITKFDLASRFGLRKTLAKVLSTLKSAGRHPVILPSTMGKTQDPQLRSFSREADEVRRVLASRPGSGAGLLVPILFTSAVTGGGISSVHALFRHLPIPPPDERRMSQGHDSQINSDTPRILFHIDEVFTTSDAQALSSPGNSTTVPGSILSGHLRYGTLAVGDTLLIGPVALDEGLDDPEHIDNHQSTSFPGSLKRSSKGKAFAQDAERSSSSNVFGSAPHTSDSVSRFASKWQRVQIISIRNLRLPVRKLFAGQVGTIAITSTVQNNMTNGLSPSMDDRLRKGMVIINPPEGINDCRSLSHSGFAALFRRDEIFTILSGSLVIVYIASIRASARITDAKMSKSESNREHGAMEEVLEFDNNDSDDGGVDFSGNPSGADVAEASFQFVTWPEWVELGTQVLIMPGGGSGASGHLEHGNNGNSIIGLDGFVGRITRTWH
ncbi:hypothetical protein MMC12_000637 [Toensbergia leucococca]|nr:hypothetical protein [Toensbergia leucococca]